LVELRYIQHYRNNSCRRGKGIAVGIAELGQKKGLPLDVTVVVTISSSQVRIVAFSPGFVCVCVCCLSVPNIRNGFSGMRAAESSNILSSESAIYIRHRRVNSDRLGATPYFASSWPETDSIKRKFVHKKSGAV